MEILRKVFESVAGRLQHQAAVLLPPLLAGVVILLVAYLLAVFSRWLILRAFRGFAIDRFLRRSGLAFVLDPSGRLRAANVAAHGAYWTFLLAGWLTALSVFDTDLTTHMVQGFVLLLPQLLLSGLILLAGIWLAHYLGRGALVWAVQEGFPGPRRLAAVVRLLVTFVAVVVAADQLNFARTVFLAAFIITCGGIVLAASLAAGLGAGRYLDRYLQAKGEDSKW